MPNVHKITTRTNLHKPILKLTHTNIITCARANTASEKVFHNGCIGIDHQTKRDITITSNKFFLTHNYQVNFSGQTTTIT